MTFPIIELEAGANYSNKWGESMGIRTGTQYVQSLKDRREVWMNGEKVKDVTVHPAFRNGVQSIARLYDIQHEASKQDTLTFVDSKTNERVAMSYLIPTKPEHVVSKRKAFEWMAEETHGYMGRSPDFLNTVVAAWAGDADFFAQGGQQYKNNVLSFYDYCCENDVSMTHAIIDPQIDRSKGPSEQEDPYTYLGTVSEEIDGIIVRGARMLATLAPMANELLVYPFARLGEKDANYALAFAIPINTPGLKVICREPLDLDRGKFNHPMGSRYDEVDALIVFDDVLVPWERLFIYKNVELCNNLRRDTAMAPFTAQQAATRSRVKAEFVVGVSALLAETVAINEFLHIQQKLGEMIINIDMLQACVTASESNIRQKPSGIYVPDLPPLQAALISFTHIYPRFVEILQVLGAGGLMMTPNEKDFSSELAPLLQKYYRGANAGAEERVQLYKLAWDIAGDGFGQRQVLYERFYIGDPIRQMAMRYKTHDMSKITAKVKALLKEFSLS